ncbi:MAG: hypothetical protein PHD25_08910 [Bacteroidales bacterium]|nr:hypothetical protein [Bacteroidales bacterium]
MKKWVIPTIPEDLRYPDEILQEFADALATDTRNALTGQVTESISYDSYERPKIYYALHVYITKLKQSYRLLEIEQIEDKPYPVNLKIVLYTGSQVFDNLKDAKALNDKLDEIAKNSLVGNLLAHFIRLSELKED